MSVFEENGNDLINLMHFWTSNKTTIKLELESAFLSFQRFRIPDAKNEKGRELNTVMERRNISCNIWNIDTVETDELKFKYELLKLTNCSF